MQSRGPGNTHREVTYLSWAALPYAFACGCVLANADKRLTIFKRVSVVSANGGERGGSVREGKGGHVGRRVRGAGEGGKVGGR